MFRTFSGAGLLLALAVLPAAAAPAPVRLHKQDASLSQSVLRIALGRRTQPTADPGLPFTCADFVAWVMHQAHAKSTEDFGVSGMDPGLNYVWGDLVVTHNAGDPDTDFGLARPGDVLQFRGVIGPNSGGKYEQHTAIVSRNLGGGKFILLEQNVAGQPFVTLDPPDTPNDQPDFSHMTGGTIWVYRPVAKPN